MKKLTLDDFIQKSKTKYGDLFNYSLCDYKGGHNLITLICSSGHTFQTYPSTHLTKNSRGGCKECYKLNVFNNRKCKYNQMTFIEACNKVHNNTYDYSKTIYTGLYDKVTITCKIHGDFIQKGVVHLLNECGCSKCGRIKTETSIQLSQEKIDAKIVKFNKIHNNKYEYGRIYRDNGILWLEIICPTHGSHITRFFNHEKGHGCPKCVSVRSNVQIEWLEYRMVTDGFIQHSDNLGEYTIPGTKLLVDGYNEKTNTVYEFQGDFWHGNPDIYDLDAVNKKLNVTYRELYDKTMNKINTLQDMGYNVIYIWENDWRKLIKAVTIIQRRWRKSKQF